METKESDQHLSTNRIASYCNDTIDKEDKAKLLEHTEVCKHCLVTVTKVMSDRGLFT